MRHDVITLTPTLSLKGRGRFARTLPAVLAAAFVCCAGCIRITIDPQCPEEIVEGSTGELVANEANTGAIPTYLWEADPAGRVTIADDKEASTSFEALRSGQVIFTLTASDGLFQMIDTCTTVITTATEPEPLPEPEPNIIVTLVANPTTVEPSGSTLLTCTNTGTTSATLTIDQLDGAPVEVTVALPGISVAEFGTELGTYTFRCLGTDAQGNRSEPALVRVTLSGGPRPPPR
jgi:hypothetical protein